MLPAGGPLVRSITPDKEDLILFDAGVNARLLIGHPRGNRCRHDATPTLRKDQRYRRRGAGLRRRMDVP